MKRSNNKKANEVRWNFKKKHHADVAKAMQRVLARETYENCLNDAALTEAIMEQGVYCTRTITHKVRTDLGIVGSDQRKVELFAKEHGKKK